MTISDNMLETLAASKNKNVYIMKRVQYWRKQGTDLKTCYKIAKAEMDEIADKYDLQADD